MNESYFPGGYLADHPNGNVIMRVVDNGDVRAIAAAPGGGTVATIALPARPPTEAP